MNGKASLIIILLIIAFAPMTNIASEIESCIQLKEVLDNVFSNPHKNYEYGKHRYPNFKVKGLSESFTIKKQPDMLLCQHDISFIEINKMYGKLKTIDYYWVKIYFSSSGKKKMKEYTSLRVNQKIAFEICDTIFLIATLIEPIEDVFAIPITNRNITEIKMIFHPVCKNILTVE